MFVDDKPIKKSGQDRLGRVSFSEKLAESIGDWKGTESLVVALYGKWGSGKSSVINLCKETLEKMKPDSRPTLIEFNPWLFSGEEGLAEHFFNEVAKELSIKNEGKNDLELAEKIRSYSKLFGLLPSNGTLEALIAKALVVMGIIGVSVGQVLGWLHFDYGATQQVVTVVGVGLLFLSTCNDYLEKFADYVEQRGKTKDDSVLTLKQRIVETLRTREKKIVIVIDDIDRLTPEETRIIFKLVKVNTDFPNVLFLLSFDRQVVCDALRTQPGISGQDYIEKIVQVSFDIPLAKPEKVAKILFEELDRILAGLPESGSKMFDQTYWGNIYHTGLKYYFRNVRDVKRFASGLEFNLSLLYRDQVMEVNPIDFIAIESIRVFLPDIYAFIRVNKELFTSTDRERRGYQENTRAKEILAEIEKAPEHLRVYTKELLSRLFPQLQGVFTQGYSTYGSDRITDWNRSLKVCSPECFDAYFTLIPGGDEEEVSQFEMERIFSAASDCVKLEELLRGYIREEKIRKVLSRLENYTSDQNKLPKENYQNIVQALFNISDDMPSGRYGMFDFGADMQTARIVYQLLKQNADKEENFHILSKAIERSTAVYGPVYSVALESQNDAQEKKDLSVVPAGRLAGLQQACLEKIRMTGERLSDRSNLASILYRWKEWAADPKEWQDFVNAQIMSDENLPRLLKGFVGESTSQTFGDYVGRKKKSFNYKSLQEFANIEDVKLRVEHVMVNAPAIYAEHKENFDLFLENYGKTPGPLDD